MAVSLDALTAEVAAVKSVEASAVALISGIADRITAATASADAATQAAIADVVADLKASSDALAAAVAANTLAAPAPVEPAPEAPAV